MNKISENIKSEIECLIEIGHSNGKLSRSTIIHLLNEKGKIDELNMVMEYMMSQNVSFTDDDIENDNPRDNTILYEPFDSTKINIIPKAISLEGILTRIKYDEINMDTYFQRKSGLWNNVTKSQLIESMMLRIPIPVFYFDGTIDDKWLVIDGLQRLSTFKDFFINKSLELEGLEYFSDYNGCRCDNIPRTYLRRMYETQLSIYIIQPGTPDNVKFNIFKRINTPGLKLENQEIRHALYYGKSTVLLKELAESDLFSDVTNHSISNDRMLANEIVLRYFSFVVLGKDEYKGDWDSFLGDTMQTINGMSDFEISKLKDNYYNNLRRAKIIFGPYAFRKITAVQNSRKNPFNVSLYDSWLVNFNELNECEFDVLVDKKNILLERFVELLQDKTFGYDISSAKRSAVLRRISTIKELIKEVVYD